MDNTEAFDGFPLILGWELTLACDLQCGHCGSSAGTPRQHELTTEEALALCDQFPQMLVQEVDFTGGEPLLREDWPLLAMRLRDHGIAVKIVTNGTTLDDATITLMKETGVAGIGVSIDGLAATHDMIRGYVGLYDSLMASIEKAIVSGLSLTVITGIHPFNLHELAEMMYRFLAAGVRNWRLQPIFPLGRALTSSSQLRLTERDFLEFGSFIKKWEPRARAEGMIMRTGDAFGFFTELDDGDPPWRGCPAGMFSCGITSDGGIKGCLSMPDNLIEGNLREHDFWDIWFHPDSFAYNRKFSSVGPDSLCADCDRVEQCRGGCNAMSYARTGQFHNDSYCYHGIRTRWADAPQEPVFQDGSRG
jgi:radical SAM protein with 4Fe4S-binding SPASM domain